MRESRGEKIFHIVVNILLLLIAFCCIYPVLYVLSASFSSMRAVSAGEVVLFPKEFNIKAYEAVFKEKDIWTGYYNAIYYTLFGTAFSLIITICGAYPLSRKKFYGKGLILAMVAISMWFSPGLIPQYLNFVELGLLDTRMAVILVGGCAGMYVIIMRTFFQSIPDSLEEAAIIDGANLLQVLCRVYLPLSRAAIATLGLMYAVSRWNGYVWSLILVKNEALQPLQVVLKRLIVDITFSATEEGDSVTDYSVKMLTYAIMVVSMAPMLVLYPFVQKYFEKGIMVGSIKG